MFELYKTYIIDEEWTVMCIGLDQEQYFAVLAPFYADDEDFTPELHVEDGVSIFNMAMEYPNIKPFRAFKKEFDVRLTVELYDKPKLPIFEVQR